jgi:hypothetical protein
MSKQAYVKIEMERIELNSAERLAACDYYYKTGLSGGGCHTTFFFDSNPASCLVMTTPQSVS